MRIVVFGAGGFVGGWICEELCRRKGFDTVACVRKWASAVRLARRGIHLRRADLDDVNEIAAIMVGADAVINAALPEPAREPELVTALYSACNDAGVRRFVHFSSTAVYGDHTGEVDEDVARAPNDDYSRGKADAECRLIEAIGADTQLVVLRPSIIYGPFSNNWTVRYVQRIVKGRWLGLGRLGEGTCNLVHGHDVAKAAVAAATADVAPGVHVLNINGPEAVTWNQYIEKLSAALGTTDRVVPNVPWFLAMAVAAETLRMAGQLSLVRALYRRSSGATRGAMKNAQAATKLYPSLREIELLSRKVHYRADRAERVLKFEPSMRLEEGLRQSAAWCRMHGIV